MTGIFIQQFMKKAVIDVKKRIETVRIGLFYVYFLGKL